MPGLCWNFWIVKSFSVGISWLTDAFRYRIINLKNIYTHVFFFLAFLAEVQSCLREFCPACRWHFSDSGFLSLWVRVKWYKCLESVRRILLRRSIYQHVFFMPYVMPYSDSREGVFAYWVCIAFEFTSIFPVCVWCLISWCFLLLQRGLYPAPPGCLNIEYLRFVWRSFDCLRWDPCWATTIGPNLYRLLWY